MRAALYARFSTDLQNPESIADQLVVCRRTAERMGATVVAEFTDAAISGASMVNRPGLNSLLAGAKAGQFDVVIAEALDRLTRSGGDAWDIFDDLHAAGVRIHTASEGNVEELAIGFAGTMNAIFLRELGKKVRRGLEGVVRSGRYPSRPPYGYALAKTYDDRGERIRGQLEIVETEAAIVRRIAAEFLAGLTGHAICHRLNAEGVAGPNGGAWEYNNVTGRPGGLRGVLRNPLYAGELVWNRQTRLKNRRTGGASLRNNAPADFVRHAAPALRILDSDTWAAVQARLAARAAMVATVSNPSGANAPKRLLTGLVRCGLCGGAMNTIGRQRRYRCVARTRNGPSACANARTAPADDVERQVLDLLRRDLLHPDVVDAFVREYHAAQAARGSGAQARRDALDRELTDVRRRAGRLVDQVADGVLTGPTVAAKLAALEARQAQIEAELGRERSTADIVALHPKAADRYRQIVADLAAKLGGAEGQAHGSPELISAREALRRVVRQVRIQPGEDRGAWSLEIDADLTGLLGLQALPAQNSSAGARGR